MSWASSQPGYIGVDKEVSDLSPASDREMTLGVAMSNWDR